MPNHLLGHCLSGHEHSSDVHLKHCVGIFGAVFKRRRLLLYTSRRDEPIELALSIRDVADDLIQLWDISNIDLSVVQRCAYGPSAQMANPLIIITHQALQQPAFAPGRNQDLALAVCPRHTPSHPLRAVLPPERDPDLELHQSLARPCRSD